MGNLPKVSTTGGLASLLKDNEVKFNEDEKRIICCILTTAEYCQVRNFVVICYKILIFEYSIYFECFEHSRHVLTKSVTIFLVISSRLPD